MSRTGSKTCSFYLLLTLSQGRISHLSLEDSLNAFNFICSARSTLLSIPYLQYYHLKSFSCLIFSSVQVFLSRVGKKIFGIANLNQKKNSQRLFEVRKIIILKIKLYFSPRSIYERMCLMGLDNSQSFLPIFSVLNNANT